MKILRIATVPISLKILTKGQLLYLKNNNFDVYTASANGMEIDDIYTQEKITKHYTVSLSRKISPFKDLLAIWQCVFIIIKLKPIIVHTYTPKAGMVGMIASFLAGIKIRLHNVTGLPLMEKTGFIKRLLITIERLTYYFATDVYVNSYGLLNYIKANISDHDKIKILGDGSTNGIDSSFFSADEILKTENKELKLQLKINEYDFVWIFVGRLVRDKGIVELIDAFEKINNGSKLLLVGNYEEHLDPLPIETMKKIKNNKNIIEIGFVNDVRKYLMLSNCLVFPSYREGLPNVPMQAGCLNVPIIATNINGCNEIVTHLENGILVNPKDTIDLYNAMIYLYNNKKLQKEMAQKSRSLILEKYEQKKVWSNILKEYQIKLSNV